ncbi:hypothetical protein FQN52_001198 [Onygenales sp. PD_12]|nr:hypothetical protein FQN52_001198 [Onygenales sp. PD_12]
MSFNLLPTNHFPPLEGKTKERKVRYQLPSLQVKWPMRQYIRSTDGSPTTTKPKYGLRAIRMGKSKSVDLPKSVSTGMVGDIIQPHSATDRPILPPHSPIDSSFEWAQKQDSPGLPDAHALESVRSPQEVTPWSPTPDKRTKALNSAYAVAAPVNGPSGEYYELTKTDQIQNSHPSHSSTSDTSPPPVPHGRNRSDSKISDIETPQDFSATFTSGTVSPILSLFHNRPVSPANDDKTSVAGLSIVSPLSIDMPQPRRFFAPPTFDKVLKTETSPSLTQTQKSGDSASSSECTRSVSLPNSPSSSRSSIYSTDISPKHTTLDAEAGSVRSRAYSLISPISAGVFDDDPDLKRNPTFKKKHSMKQLRNKPLPPEPTIKVPPLSIRRTSAPMSTARYGGRLIQPASQPKFLPANPRPSDLDILDEAFRRSGLHRGLSKKRTKSKSKSRSPSLRKATQELEEKLSALSSTADNTGNERPRTRYFTIKSHDSPLKSAKPLSYFRRSDSHSIVSPAWTTTQSPEATKIHASFSVSSKKSWSGRESIKVTPSIVEPTEAKDKAQPQPPATLAPHVPSGEKDDAKPVEKTTRLPSFVKGRKAAGERNLRLRLPRLRTQLGAKNDSAPVHLSVVMESPADRSTNPSSPKERIMAALDRLDRLSAQPEPPTNNTTPAPEQPPVFELDASDASSPARPSNAVGSKEMLTHEIPSAVAASIIYGIMQKIDNLEDLFNLAAINRGFYRVFKEHALSLIKDTLFRMSPAAWELREISPPWETEHEAAEIDMPVPEYTPNLYIQHYTRDLFTMVALKSLILVRCESFLRPDTARALAGLDEVRCNEIDDAFWRVWTFCKLFGCGKGREDDVTAQADWLNGGHVAENESRGTSMLLQYPFGVNSVLFDAPPGFAKGNHGGLSSTELYDMMEIWTCLGVLLQVFHGKCKEARQFGVFEGFEVKVGDVAQEEALIERWTQYLLTLGPSAILALISINADSPIETLFSRAQSNGWTTWTSPSQTPTSPPRLFLKEAVSQVYEARISNIETPMSSGTPGSHLSGHNSRSPSPKNIAQAGSETLSSVPDGIKRRRQFAAELRRKRKESQDSDMSIGSDIPSAGAAFTDERPISQFSTVIYRLDGTRTVALDAPPVPSLPTTVPNRPVHLNMPATRRTPEPRTNSSIQNTPIVSEASPSIPTLSVSSPTPPPLISSTSSPSTSSNTPHLHHSPPQPSSPEVVVEEKISRGRYPTHTSQILDPVDMAMHKMVTELGFNEADAKWALKCTDTGESLDVTAAINLLLRGGGRMDPTSISMSSSGNTMTALDSQGLYRSKTTGDGMGMGMAMGIRQDMVEYDDVWRPVWRWA